MSPSPAFGERRLGRALKSGPPDRTHLVSLRKAFPYYVLPPVTFETPADSNRRIMGRMLPPNPPLLARSYAFSVTPS